MQCMDCCSTFTNDVGQRVFIWALWRSVNYKQFYLYAYGTIAGLLIGLRTCFHIFNQDLNRSSALVLSSNSLLSNSTFPNKYR